MPARAPCRALSVVLILLSAPPPAARACPHPCACYVPSEVHCTFRSLASVPAGISKHVERINLGFNSIQALSETSFAGLSKLELLMLHGNNIPSVPDGALRDLGSLQVFKFSYNKLRVITAQTLQGLRSLLRLHVDHNEIEFIHPHAFQGLTALRLLHLEGNMLHQLHPGTFSTFCFLDYFRLSNIRHLYLADNRLRSLPAGMLQNMPLLENLYLHGNPWSCDCDMRWFLEWHGKSKESEVQPSDGGYYRCVAVNPLGADHFAVAVSVRKKGPGRSSPKRGQRPGGKTASRPRDVAEDEGGSADDAISTSRLHPKDQETFVTTKEEASAGGQKAKKGRRKLKGWKTPMKEADTGVAEGRRVFESRRKINMANKQITPEREQTDNLWLEENGFRTQDNARRTKGTEDNSLGVREGGEPGADAARSRSPDTERPGVASTASTDSSGGAKNTMLGPQNSALHPPVEKDTATVAVTVPTEQSPSPSPPTTQPPRKRPNGRRKLRPHKSRHQDPQTPPATSASADAAPARPTPARDVTVTDKAESSPSHTSRLESTAGPRRRLDVDKHAGAGGGGTPRRKPGKRPHRHRHRHGGLATAPASTPGPATDGRAPTAEASLPSTTLPLRTREPHHMSRAEGYVTTSSETHLSRGTLQGTLAVTDAPISRPKDVENDGGTNTDDDKGVRVASDADSVIHVPSPSGSGASTVGAFTEESGFLGSKSWGTPKAAQPGALQTDTRAPASPETGTRPSVFTELGDLDPPSEASPSAAASAPFQQEGLAAATAASSVNVESSRTQGHSKVSGDDRLPELTQPAGKAPRVGPHPSPDGRTPFFLNRTFSFPQWAATPKPPPATAPAPGTRPRIVHTGPYSRTHSQSVIHVDFGPPAPPAPHRPQGTVPPSARVQNGPVLYSTRSPVPFATSSGQSSRSFHQSSSKFFSAGGPPASKFWTLGEKPQIVTKSPQTVSVAADTDVLLPCEATGKPKPFVTWTKVSTGALMTPNTRLQRFEVLKNGSFVIRRAQAQDGGRYLCTAKNLHGADRMLVQLSVAAQQPQIVAGHYQDVTVSLGDTIAMECLAKGTPVPHISWIFPDGRVWQAASRAQGRVTLHENRTLSIRDASFADRGVYKCVASNAAGADSLAIRLHVAALPPVIQQDKLENISLPPGLSVQVHCSAKAAPRASLRWVLADGTHVRPSQFVHGNLFVFPNGTLYIRNLAPKDSGRYECVAANLVGAARRTVQLSVPRAAANARITGSSPHRTDVRYGATLRLDCSASGDPWPRILWRLPSKRMIDALFSFDPRVRAFANGTLVVSSVTDKDAGDYLCVARNQVGDDFVVLQVHVVMKPAKIEYKEEQDHRVFYGADLRVDCVASGLPDPEIVWGLPDGSLVHSFVQSDDGGGGRGQRYVVFNNGTLYFNEVGMREAGDYTCFAKNQVGRDEMTVHVKVVAEPAAIRNKTYAVVHVPYGDVVTVACEAKGEPTPRVTWLSPTNKPIPTSSEKYQIYEDGTLLIQKAQRSDSGNYTCVVRNSAGEDRKVVWVHVHVQSPKINGNPDAITTVREIAAGGSRKLIDCLAEGVPTPRVLWAFPEGVVLPAPYYGHRVTVHRNGTLDIKSLRKSDSVQLACIGRNEGGEARLIVQLTVLEPMEKPFFHDPVTEKITATAGHTISLNCSAAGSPPPTLRWVLPNGTELASGRQLHRFYHKSDGRLHVSGLSPGDAGAYRCVARNAAGHSERLVSLKVGLRKAPASSPQHSVVSILNGETLRLPCPPAPPPGRPARMSWTLPSGTILHGPQARGRVSVWDNGTLTVREASVFDRGTYACQTDAESGPSAVSYAVIVIAYPPRITSEPTPVIYARPGHAVTMKCMAVGVPKAEITWELPDRSQLTAGSQARLYGNRQLHPHGSLTIQQATRSDAGFYKCTAKNILGRDTKTTYIHVY
ncbi:matrix-remodeling-associated protein 5 [Pteropus vampyrus]|uniref:Matrix-remodeling-associated protein 5 n=1 Tax=Pteropus vampyrus TaxID=132908 RepID=A0A6P6BWN1_PTEVA|nr:matrix-remodeling-associated protein 5 [Pteropus vampyrus]